MNLLFSFVGRTGRGGLWLTAIAGLLFLTPVLWWNSRHEWIMFQHTSEHFGGGATHWGTTFARAGEYLAGQAAVLSPLTGLLVLMETLGAALGLFILGMLQQQAGDLSRYIPMISLATLIAAGCEQAEPPKFRLNMVAMTTNELGQQYQQEIADVLGGIFGTPDDPQVLPETGLDQSRLTLAAGPAWSDQEGIEHGLYRKHCVHCHGVNGDGIFDGSDLVWVAQIGRTISSGLAAAVLLVDSK